MAKTRAQQNRAIRQDALREQLAAQGHVQHVVDCAKKLGEPSIENKDIQRLKTKAELHLKLIDKYLPSLKAIEYTGEGGGELDLGVKVVFVGSEDESGEG